MSIKLLSSSDVLLSLFPKIEEQLIRLGTKFGHQLEQCYEKKGNKSVLNSELMKNLLTKFPHTYSGYSKCVDDYVVVGKNSSDSSIEVLFQILPFYSSNILYNKIISKINIFESHKNFIDLFLILFFADCTAQILTTNTNSIHYESLINFGYKMCLKSINLNEDPLKIQIIKQFSVIFSLLSMHHHNKILNSFKDLLNDNDIAYHLLIHRFIRLSFHTQEDLNFIIQFINKFQEIGEKNKKDRRILDIWAHSFGKILTQFSPDGCAQILEPISKAYKLSFNMASDKETDVNYLVLCSIIILRNHQLFKTDFQTFLIEKVLKAHIRPTKIEATLLSFLTIIRGPLISKSTQFWEWGNFNAVEYPGIEFSQLMYPEEDQSLTNSFTSLFFQHLIKEMPIWNYPEIVGAILSNFAARDFDYFMLETIPKFITVLGLDNVLLSLHSCLSSFVDEKLHFSQWAQENPRNLQIRIPQLIPVLFVQLKSILLQTFSKVLTKKLTTEGFCFELTESVKPPIFSLPFTTLPIPELSKKTILESTKKVISILEEWDIPDKSVNNVLRNDFGTFDSITSEEELHLKILAFLPRIVNSSDLYSNDRLSQLFNLLISASRSISVFTIRVLNQLFVVHEDLRFPIFENLISKISVTKEFHHVFIYLQFLNKLFDLSLSPCDDIERLNLLIVKTQSLILYLLCFPVVEIRELTLQLLNKLYRFANGFNLVPYLFDTINDNAVLISTNVRKKVFSHQTGRINPQIISDSLISFEDACCARLDHIFQYFLAEIMSSIQKPICSDILINSYFIIKPLIDSFQGVPVDSNDTDFMFYHNLCIVLFYLSPVLPDKSYELLKSIYAHDHNAADYKNPIFFATGNEPNQKNFLNILPLCVSTLASTVSLFGLYDYRRNVNITKLWKHMSWTILSESIPYLSNLIKNSTNISSDYSILLSVSQVFKVCAMNSQFPIAISCNDESKDAFVLFIKAAELFFVEKKVNGTRRFENIQDLNLIELKKILELALNYCQIIELFFSCISPIRAKTNDGPLRSPIFNHWVTNGSWNIESRRSSLSYLTNWSKLHEAEDSLLVSLGDAAASSISVFIRSGLLFDKNYRIPVDLESLLISLEKNGIPTLRYILSSHYLDMLPIFINYAYNSPPELAPLFFNSICLQYTRQDFDNRRAIFDDLSTRFTNRMKSITNAMTSLGGMIRKIARSARTEESEFVPLSDHDILINNNFIENSGKLILLGLLYLSHHDFQIRCSAFRFVQRAAPVIHHILNPEGGKTNAKFIKRLNAFSPSFFSNFVTITVDTVLKVSELFSQFLPSITEPLVQEAFNNLTTSAKGSFLDSSKKAILLDIAAVFMRNQSLTNDEKKQLYPPCFIIYSPYSILRALLEILPSIETSSLKSYLGLWTGLATTEENVDFIVNFLIDSSSDILNENSVKTVLVHLSLKHPAKIINLISLQLTFSNWWHLTYQNNLNTICPPSNINFQRFNTLLMTLTELVQFCMEYVNPYFPIIIQFCILFYDIKPILISELLLVILWSFSHCPDSLTSIFLPPSSLIWLNDILLNWSPDTKNNISSTILSLKQSKKEPITVLNFVNQFSTFLRKNEMNNLVIEWGNEALRWCCGCGDLLIASKSALIFSQLIEPFNLEIYESLSESFLIVASTVTSNQKLLYISSILNIFDSIFEKSNNIEELKSLFKDFIPLITPFITLTSEPILCRFSISILSKYILKIGLPEQDLLNILNSLSLLFSINFYPNTTISCLLSICFINKDDSNNILPIKALILLLPFLYQMISAIHNIQPFSIKIIDDLQISSIIESVLLLSECSCFLPNEQEHLNLLEEPELIKPNEFLFSLCNFLVLNHENILIDSISILNELLKNSNSDELILSIFAITRLILDSKPSNNLIILLSNIIEIATKYSSNYSIELLESYLTLIPKNYDLNNIQINNLILFKFENWEIHFNIKNIKLLNLKTELKEFCPILPLELNSWQNKIILNYREQIININILPFTDIKNNLINIKNQPLNKGNNFIEIDKNALKFLNFRTFLNDLDE